MREPYVLQRTWDYFVEHLQGREPPSGVEFDHFVGQRGGIGQLTAPVVGNGQAGVRVRGPGADLHRPPERSDRFIPSPKSLQGACRVVMQHWVHWIDPQRLSDEL